MNERTFQGILIRQIRDLFPGCIVLKNDPTYIQGIPDIIILFREKWAALEVKKDGRARRQPNQEHYIHQMNLMSYASFVCPENVKDVLDDLQHTFGTFRSARFS